MSPRVAVAFAGCPLLKLNDATVMVYVAEPATIINERNKNKLYNKKL